MATNCVRQPGWVAIPLPSHSAIFVRTCRDGLKWAESDEALGEYELDQEMDERRLISIYFSNPHTAFEYKMKFG